MTERERSEAPTAHRLSRARRRGQVVHSPVLTSAIAWFTFAAIVDSGAPRAWGALAAFAKALWSPTSFARNRIWEPSPAGEAALRWLVEVLGWSCGLTLIAAVLIGALQTGAHLRIEAIAPDVSRLFAGRGSRRTVGRQLGVGGIALVFVGVATLATFLDVAPSLSRLSTSSPRGILIAGAAFTRELAGRILVALLFAGIGDWLWRRAQLRRELMMTPDEVKRETRELEGDVRLKVERRRLATSSDARDAPLRWSGVAGDLVVVGYSAQAGTCAVVLRRRHEPDRVAGGAHARSPIVVAKARRAEAGSIMSGAVVLGLSVHEDLALASALWFVPVGAAVPDILLERVVEFFPT